MTDRARSGVGDEVKEFASSIDKVLPNGVCFSHGRLALPGRAEPRAGLPRRRVLLRGPGRGGRRRRAAKGELIPKAEESFNHTARVCRIGPDNKLYITLGQPFNVPPPAKSRPRIRSGASAASSAWTRTARTARSTPTACATRSAWTSTRRTRRCGSPTTRSTAWATTFPPGELNRATKAGQNFGFPWYGGGKTRTDDYKNETPPADVVFPQVEQVAHAADLGMTFYYRQDVPARKYQGGIFSAQHGSWNRTVPVGARVMFTSRQGRRHGQQVRALRAKAG